MDMVAWWEAMNFIQQLFAVIGIASTILLVIQVILLIIGAGDSGTDTDSGPGGEDIDIGDDIDFSDADAGVAGGDLDLPDSSGAAGDWYGESGDTTFESHYGSAGLRLFTLQGLISFFAVFGWSGLLMLKSGFGTPLSVVLAALFGFIAMALIAWIFKAMLKLQSDGTLDIRNSLGKSGTVYLNIPARREYSGKVSLLIQDRLIELDAVTDEENPIRTGAEITVVGVSGRNTLIVRSK